MASRRSRRRRTRTQAQQADRYELYQQSVQEPDPDLRLVSRTFQRHHGRPPRLLREDFCAAAALACRWVELHRENRALGIDLDPEPLDWGRRHNLAKLKPEQASRIKLIEGDVRDVGVAKVDVTLAFNFSYFIFDTRPAMLDYFRRARASLLPQGLLVLDAYGGADSQRTSEEERELDGFTYVWDQHRFDPISHRAVNYIHFEFPDGSRMNRAFAYEWRLWSLPEIRELLAEAGFRHSEVYWEGTDHATGEGNGVFRLAESAPDDPAWVCYIAAIP
jgi:cyclopropane fatty-acyl-phospholipid synthase-like methyltransferase